MKEIIFDEDKNELVTYNNVVFTNIFKNKKIRKKYMSIYSIIIVFLGIFFCLFLIENSNEKRTYANALNYCNSLYDSNHNLKANVSIKNLNKCEEKIELVINNNLKEPLYIENYESKEYITAKNMIENISKNNILNATTSINKINDIEEYLKNNVNKYYSKLSTILNDLKEQYNFIAKVKNEVDNLKNSTDINDAEIVKQMIRELKQDDLKTELLEKINELESKISSENMIAKLNIEYISQNKNNILNGCEAASMLMALKYKGYLKDMTLNQFVDKMPKSDNPNKGFYLSVYDLEPSEISHWIAPEPLVNYAKKISGNNDIINATGFDIELLRDEVIKGNPVVIYLTSGFTKPTSFSNGVPKNLHVLLLAGFNKTNNQFIIYDPWTWRNDVYEFNIGINEINNIYTQLGKMAIIIK